mgnify:FL=1
MAFQKHDKKQDKKKVEYIKLSDAQGGASYCESSEMWLKSGKYPAPGISIPISGDQTLSDWVRHITLEDVTLIVDTRKGSDGKEYPELTIRGGDASDLPF